MCSWHSGDILLLLRFGPWGEDPQLSQLLDEAATMIHILLWLRGYGEMMIEVKCKITGTEKPNHSSCLFRD